MIISLTNADYVTSEKFVTSRLFKRERCVFLHFLKRRWPNAFTRSLKKRNVSSVNAFDDILNSLRTYLFPPVDTITQLSNVSLQFTLLQILTKHTVVALM